MYLQDKIGKGGKSLVEDTTGMKDCLYELHKLSLVNKMLFSEVQSIHLFFHTCTLLSILLTDDGCEP